MASSSVSTRMTPRTGAKYSVRWNSLPGTTPARMPGVHRPPPRQRGLSTQCSPGPSVVSPRRAFSSSGTTTGPTWESRAEGAPTRSDAAASTSWRAMRAECPADPTRISREDAEHFWPAWANAEETMSRTARSGSADGVTIMAFLPLVSPSRCMSGFHDLKRRAVS